ncbi:molybdopterin converting factor [Corynebacterium phocae]|uniref:Molybdopterin converting factor n=1 Tax=Corynebacterium phocae TaxID=161895 RepID=A0A1L7D0R5_9CORY|nr:molybdenum cofactor biosynthesis protein MoaE [Corynebacterium phocae]APT91694.1 molybdopterin converting factor [Corynebacterium phocae]KAA8728603.1 molybdenum cofactor biosynthesis protein MoaE [Corynebacterium phocae]
MIIDAFITADPIAVPDIATPADGAVVRFDGVVRNHDGGRGGVELLTYTAHPSAQAEIERVAADVAGGYPDVRLWCAHRTGDLCVGELAFVVLAASAHRAHAFAAAAALADRVKAEVPIWKEQIFTDGHVNWVGLD